MLGELKQKEFTRSIPALNISIKATADIESGTGKQYDTKIEIPESQFWLGGRDNMENFCTELNDLIEKYRI